MSKPLSKRAVNHVDPLIEAANRDTEIVRMRQIEQRPCLRAELRVVWALLRQLTFESSAVPYQAQVEQAEDLIYDFRAACVERFDREYARVYGEPPPHAAHPNAQQYLTLVMPEFASEWQSWSSAVRLVTQGRALLVDNDAPPQPAFALRAQFSCGGRVAAYTWA